MDYLTVNEAAQLLGASPSLIQKRCRDGSIPCIRVGAHYRILRSDLESWTQYRPQPSLANSKVSPETLMVIHAQIDQWLKHLAITDKAPMTIANYKCYLTSFIRRLNARGRGIPSVSHLYLRDNLAAGFETMTGKSRSLKNNTVIALVSFGNFLVAEGMLRPDQVNLVRGFKPARGADARRTSLREGDIPKLFQAIASRSKDPLENVTMAAMVGTMLFAGLRVTEVCKLAIKDVCLEDRLLKVRHGKGRKDRQLGMRRQLFDLLTVYLEVRTQIKREHGHLNADQGERPFFLRSDGTAWSKDQLARRMRHISRLMDIDITCHGLRRTFATIAAGQGRSVNYLRIALGHTTLTSTQEYLRTTEAEVCEAMRTW
ncbi:Tyrosine recombinase XerC [compost metagenome]